MKQAKYNELRALGKELRESLALYYKDADNKYKGSQDTYSKLMDVVNKIAEVLK